MLQPNSKFTDLVKAVDAELRTIDGLKDAGHIAQTADMMEIVSGTGQRESCVTHHGEVADNR